MIGKQIRESGSRFEQQVYRGLKRNPLVRFNASPEGSVVKQRKQLLNTLTKLGKIFPSL